MDMLEEIKKAFHQIAPEINFDTLNLNLPFRDQVDIDSLDLFKILTRLYQQTGINIPDSKLLELQTINDLASFLRCQQT